MTRKTAERTRKRVRHECVECGHDLADRDINHDRCLGAGRREARS